MYRKQTNRRWLRWLCLCLACTFILPSAALAQKPKTVRVGFYGKEGFHAVDGAGRHSGYDYEYLLKLAEYTGWQYEFVEGTWEECQEMLTRGEIDLLGGLEKTAEREDAVMFSDIPVLETAACLLQPAQEKPYAFEDFSAFDGMRIGVLAGSTVVDALESYSRKQGFRYQLMEYESETDLKAALYAEYIDCACLTSVRDLSAYTAVAYFGYSSLYYAISPQRTDLAAELNRALKEISVSEPEFRAELYRKYFEHTHSIAFTQEEQDYIRQSAPIEVALYEQIGTLVGSYDSDTGACSGIMVDVMELLSQRTGLPFTYTEIPADMLPQGYLKEHPHAVIAPALLNSMISLGGEYLYLEPIITGQMITVAHADTPVELDGNFVLAVPRGLQYRADRLSYEFPNAEIVACDSHSSGLQMVADGEADMALVNEITAAYQMQSPFFHDLRIINLTNITEDLTLGLSFDADPLLVSILRKGIFSLSERDVRQIVVNNTASASYKMTTGEWLYQRRYSLTLTVILLAAIIYLATLRRNERKRRAEDLLENERRKADLAYQEKLFHQANFDSLTGLYNQNYFIKKADELQKSDPDTVYSTLRINLENFKMVNDLYGTDVGNAVLRQIAGCMRDSIGTHGVYGRLYADQFAVCLKVDHETLQTMMKHCIQFLEHEGQKIRIRVNVGVYEDTHHNHNTTWALDYALIAMRNGKRDDGRHIFYYQDSFLQDMRRRQHITDMMDDALAAGQFHVYLQPQYDLNDRALVGAEALARWLHPEQGIISPADFIPVFEQNRFIYQLDAYMCDRVCALLSQWLKAGKAVPVSVNLSRVDLEHDELIPMLRGALERHQVPVRYLHIEITESVCSDDDQQAKRVIEELRSLGFCVEMDDFGCGYSSLNMLKDVPVDILKMDMQFFDGESHMDRGGNIIGSVVNMARSMGIPVIAEGVETEREADFLRAIGCSFVQGYLYGRPMPAGEFAAVLRDSTVGPKQIAPSADNGIHGLYWKMEQYEALLRNDRVILFDYDPEQDHAVFTYVDGDGKRHETAYPNYSETMVEDKRLSPEHRQAVSDALHARDQEHLELDFLGDFHNSGRFEWFHAVIYHYKRNGNYSRTIAVIRRKDG